MGKKIFFSYADSDSEYFQIPTIVSALELQPEIDKVNYWKRDAKTDISNFMFEEIVTCDDFIVFCTENSLHSKAVEQEWDLALRLGKRIIPIFEDLKYIPGILSMKRGIEVSPSPKKLSKRKIGPNIEKLIHDLQILIIDKNASTVPNFDEYQKILDKIKDNHLIREFLSDFYSKIKVNGSD